MRGKRQIFLYVLGDRPGHMSKTQMKGLERTVLFYLIVASLLSLGGAVLIVTRALP